MVDRSHSFMGPSGARKALCGVRRRLRRLLPDPLFVRRQYRDEHGRLPDLVHPRDLSEKLCWLKLNHDDPLQAVCVDKAEVRRFVAAVLGDEFLVPLLDLLTSPEDVAPERIRARQFVIKATHDSGSTLVCRDRDAFDWSAARRFFEAKLRQDYYYECRERPYRRLRPRIAVEAMLQPQGGSALFDISAWCFGGRVEMIEVADIATAADGARVVTQAYFSRDWRRLDLQRQYPPIARSVPRPKRLDDLIAAAERLTRPFPFCRADFYAPGDRLYFGEMTFAPSGGVVRFTPPSEERRLGDLLILPT
jgi:hypothetical protein